MLYSLPPGTIPRVVIRHRIKGAKKAQKRLRKNEEQNKILLNEFQKNHIWQKAKIVELKNRLGLKESQIYKWNWDMQRKLSEHKGAGSASISAPDISDHTGRKVSDWTGELAEVEMVDDDHDNEERGLGEERAEAQSQKNLTVAAAEPASHHADGPQDSEGDSLMSGEVAIEEENEQLEVHSAAPPSSTPLCHEVV